MMLQQSAFLRRINQWWNASSLGIGLALGAVIILVAVQANLRDLAESFGTELGSIALTVLIIDSLNQRRETRSEKARLIQQMHSQDKHTATQAVEDLRVRGWLTDGTLRDAPLWEANLDGSELMGADLRGAYLGWASLQGAIIQRASLQGVSLAGARLQGADLEGVDLRSASLVGANLTGARLRGANLEKADLRRANLQEAGVSVQQLIRAYAMQGATMPNGSRYDGRFQLRGDVSGAALLGIDTRNAEHMAVEWYRVSLEDYQRGKARFNATEIHQQNV